MVMFCYMFAVHEFCVTQITTHAKRHGAGKSIFH
jgi:hypothetical protein